MGIGADGCCLFIILVSIRARSRGVLCDAFGWRLLLMLTLTEADLIPCVGIFGSRVSPSMETTLTNLSAVNGRCLK